MSARFVARWIADHELWLLALIAGPLMFPERLGRAAALAALLAPLPWLCRWWAHGYLTRRTPLDLCILGLMIMVPVSVWVSVDLTLTVPKLCGIFLGFVTYYAVVNGLCSARAIWLGAGFLVLMGVGVALLSLLGTDWGTTKLFALPGLYERLPRLVQNVPRSVQGGFHPNEVGGTLTLFVPYALALALGTLEQPGGRRRWLLAGAWLAVIGLLAGVLIITKSRSSYIGVSIGLLALLLIWYRRRCWVLIPVVLVAALGGIWFVGPERLSEFLFTLDITDSAQGRFEVWQRAVYMIQDFPFTGVGLAAFSRVGDLLYPLFLVSSYEPGILHAHNLLLQVAVDLGLPGLIAYVGWLLGYGAMTVTLWRQGPGVETRALAVGLGCAMLAIQAFGLTDATAFSLGAKPGLAWWAMAGVLAAALAQLCPPTTAVPDPGPGP